MMLPISTTTMNTSSAGEASSSASSLLTQEQLPQDFVQLLSLRLAHKTSVPVLQPNGTNVSNGKDNKDKLLDTLTKNDIDLSKEDLNVLLAAFDPQANLDDKSLAKMVNSLRHNLASDDEGESSKDDLAAIQALMTMLSPSTPLNTGPQPLSQGAPSLTLTNTSDKSAKNKEDSAATSLFSLLTSTGNASADSDSLTQAVANDKSARTATNNSTHRTQAQSNNAAQSLDNASLASQLQVPQQTNSNEAQKLDLNTQSSVSTQPVVNLIPAAQTSMTNNIAQPTASAQLNAQLGTAQWQDSLGQQIIMLNRSGQQTAELRLHPEELGTLHISLKIDDNQAQIHLASANSQVRNALEAALPHLRNAMAESGINLGQSSVGSDNAGWQQAQQQANSNNTNSSGESYKQQFASSSHTAAEVLDTSVPVTVVSRSLNGVDIFA